MVSLVLVMQLLVGRWWALGAGADWRSGGNKEYQLKITTEPVDNNLATITDKLQHTP